MWTLTVVKGSVQGPLIGNRVGFLEPRSRPLIAFLHHVALLGGLLVHVQDDADIPFASLQLEAQ